MLWELLRDAIQEALVEAYPPFLLWLCCSECTLSVIFATVLILNGLGGASDLINVFFAVILLMNAALCIFGALRYTKLQREAMEIRAASPEFWAAKVLSALLRAESYRMHSGAWLVSTEEKLRRLHPLGGAG